MKRTKNRLQPLDQLDPPDLWDDVHQRSPGTEVDSPPARRNRGLVIGVAFALTAAASSFAFRALTSDMHGQVASLDTTTWASGTIEELGLSYVYPQQWHVQPFSERLGHAGFAGVLVSNEPGEIHHPIQPNGATSAWDLSQLPADGVVISVEHVSTIFDGNEPDSQFPLSLENAQVVGAGNASAGTRALLLQFGALGHSDSLRVWFGLNSSEHDQTVARLIVAGIGLAGKRSQNDGDGIGIGLTPTPGGELMAVDAVSASDVWAVGAYRTKSSFQDRSLVEQWNGSMWQRLEVPDVGRLVGVAAIATDDVWTIGFRSILHWDGTEWSVVASPRPPSSSFDSMSATGPSDVWIAGTRAGDLIGANTRGTATLVLHWDGKTWSIIPSPNPSGRHDSLEGVVALAPNEAWAAGYSESRSDHDNTLLLHWDGSTWAAVPSPNPATLNVLWGIGTDGAGGAWGVGHASIDNHLRTLFLRWDGSTWVLVPRPAEDLWSPTAISGTSTYDVWAVGSAPTSDLAIAHWNGQSWTVVVSPGKSDSGSLTGVVALSPTDAWAVGVGSHVGDARVEPLIEHWDGSMWSPVPSPRI